MVFNSGSGPQFASRSADFLHEIGFARNTKNKEEMRYMMRTEVRIEDGISKFSQVGFFLKGQMNGAIQSAKEKS